MAVVAAETRVGEMLAGTMGRGTTQLRHQQQYGVPLGSPSTTSVADVPGPEAGGILASTTGGMEASTWPRSSSSATSPAVGGHFTGLVTNSSIC